MAIIKKSDTFIMDIQSISYEQIVSKRTITPVKYNESGYFNTVENEKNSSINSRSSNKTSQEDRNLFYNYTFNDSNQQIIKREPIKLHNQSLLQKSEKLLAKRNTESVFKQHIVQNVDLLSIKSLKIITIVLASIALCVLSSAIVIKVVNTEYNVDYSSVLIPEDNVIEEFLLSSITDENVEEDNNIVLAELPTTVTYSNYKVAKYDTLDEISRKYKIQLDTLISINNIRNVRQIPSGTILKIPNIDGVFYKVKNGDSLEKLAETYKTTAIDLIDANDLQTETLQKGQTLFIPGAKLSRYELKKALGELVIWPITGRISSGFGYRANPFTGVRQFHAGLDIVAKAGTPIKAIMDGKVAETGYSSLYGNYVIIQHANNYQSLYGHMSKIKVKKGRTIYQGDIVGLEGSTGYSTGYHLHLGIYKNGKAVNPLPILNGNM